MNLKLNPETILTEAAAGDWKKHWVNSEGQRIAKPNAWGRMLSCGTISKGQNVIKGIEAIRARLNEYMSDQQTITEEEAEVKEAIAISVVNNMNPLVDKINDKRPGSNIQHFTVPKPKEEPKAAEENLTINPDVVEEIEDSSSVELVDSTVKHAAKKSPAPVVPTRVQPTRACKSSKD